MRGRGISLDDVQEDTRKIPRIAPRKQKANFGNYVIESKPLEKGFLFVRYPSGATLPRFPKQAISSKLQLILNYIIHEGRFNEKDYNDLDEFEKKVFDDLLIQSKADKKGSVKLYKHTKYNDKERDDDIKRFNILKGELIAGNDSPNIIKELKVLILKMADSKTISKTDFNKITYQLMLLK